MNENNEEEECLGFRSTLIEIPSCAAEVSYGASKRKALLRLFFICVLISLLASTTPAQDGAFDITNSKDGGKHDTDIAEIRTFHLVKFKRERRKENKALSMELLAVAYSSCAAKMEEIIYRLDLLEFSATQKYSLASNSTCNVEEAGDPYKAEMEECIDLIMEELEKENYNYCMHPISEVDPTVASLSRGAIGLIFVCLCL